MTLWSSFMSKQNNVGAVAFFGGILPAHTHAQFNDPLWPLLCQSQGRKKHPEGVAVPVLITVPGKLVKINFGCFLTPHDWWRGG